MVKEKVKVIPCEIWSRVVGYYRPTSSWNEGKRQEFEERKTINLNSTFKEVTYAKSKSN